MGNLGTILNKLRKVKTMADKSYMACCPSHKDGMETEPSLHLTVEGDKVLLKCHAGCTTENIMATLGLEMGELFLSNDPYAPAAPMPTYPTGTKPKIVATYDYKDEVGALLYQVVRYEPKSFKQRHKAADGTWDWNMNGQRRVLYHLDALKDFDKVYLVEGEKDADNLWKWAQPATTSPGGAGNWKPEYADMLAGKQVVIIPDKDEPGLKYAQAAAQSLEGIAASITCIILPGEGVKDVSDWLEKGGDYELLPQMEESIKRLTKLTFEETTDKTDIDPDLLTELTSTDKCQRISRDKIIWKEVDKWLTLHKGETFDLATICAQIDIKNRDDRHSVVKKLSYECSKENLEKSNRLYSCIDKTCTYVDWIHATQVKPINVKWPYGIDDGTRFGFDGAVHVSPGDIIVIAGLSNMGKSLFCINLLWENMDNYPCTLMGNEYTPSKFARRISKMTWKNPINGEGGPKFELIERRENWKAIIRPDNFNIIDWINLEDNFYRIGSIIEGIQSKLKTGIAVIALQKDASKALGLGGGFSEHMSSLYLTIDKLPGDNNRMGKMTCRKAKEWSGHNPNGEMYSFEVHNEGTEFRKIRAVKDCKACAGTGKSKGGECATCMGSGVVEKFGKE